MSVTCPATIPATTAQSVFGAASIQAALTVASAKSGTSSQSPVSVIRVFIGTRHKVATLNVKPNAQRGKPRRWKCSGTATNAHEIFSSERNGITNRRVTSALEGPIHDTGRSQKGRRHMWCYANEPPQETVANAKFVALYTGSAHAGGSDPKDH